MSLGGVRCKGSWLEVKGWIATAVNIATVVSVGGGDAEFTNQTSLNHFDSPTPIVLIRYRKNNVIPSFVVSFYKRFFFLFSVSSQSSSFALGYRCAWWCATLIYLHESFIELEPVLQRVRCRWFSFEHMKEHKNNELPRTNDVTRTANTQKCKWLVWTLSERI